MNLNTFIICNPYLRKDYTNKDGQQTIYLRITIPGHYIFFSTRIKIDPKNWSKKGISTNEPDAFKKNKRLKMLISKAQAIIDQYFFEWAYDPHTFSLHNALNKGVPIEIVSKMLAHTQIKTIEIYAKVSEEYIVSQFKKLL